MNELKPCPFCGGDAHVGTRMDEDIWSHNTVPYTQVACGDCEIGTDWTCEGWEPTAQEAWNRRAPSLPVEGAAGKESGTDGVGGNDGR